MQTGNPMKKSLLIITEAFEVGGVETHIAVEAEQLAREGWDVHMICGSRFSPTLVPASIKSLLVDAAVGPEASISEFLESIDRIVALAREKEVVAIHAHPFTSMISGLVCASLLRVPLMVTLHGPSSIAGTYGAAYDFLLSSLVFPSASRILAVSREVAALAAPNVDPDRLLVQLNAVEPAKAASPVRSGRWLMVSRLDAAKANGVVQFVRAALPGLPGIDICGAGPAQDQLAEDLAAEIASGKVRMIGSSDKVSELMLAYAGVAGMGRVALEGLVQGLPVVLVGYDGVKGVVTEALYREAVASNFSGRGLMSLSPEELRSQIAGVASVDHVRLMRLVRAEHNPARIWNEFAVQIEQARPVSSPVVDDYIRQLRAAHADSTASAYWSREVMDVLGKVVSSRSSDGEHLQNSLALYATTYTRNVIEQELVALRQRLEGWFTSVGALGQPDTTRDDEYFASLLSQTRQIERYLAGLTEDLEQQRAALRGAMTAESRRTLDTLREDMSGIVDTMRSGVSGIADGLKHQLGHATSDIQSQFQQEFSRFQVEMKAAVLGNAKAIGREIDVVHEELQELRGLILGSRDVFRRESQAAFNEIGRGMEKRMERKLARMESEIRVDLGRMSTGIEKTAVAERDLEALRARVAALEYELRDVYESTSWALTRPLRVLKRLIVQPRATVKLITTELAATPTPGPVATRPAPWRRALNLIRRTAKTGRLDPADQRRLAAMVRTNCAAVVQSVGLEVPRPHLATAGELADVFVWSVIDWHFRVQRPQHLAAAMARKGHRVFYISNNFVDSGSPGFTVESLDGSGRLFQVNLNLRGAPQIYSDLASPDQAAAIRDSLAQLLKWTRTRKSISLVQHPYWIEPAQCLPNMHLVYDCMDHHGGFENNASSVLRGEQWLVRRSDLLVVTSQWLYDELAPLSRNVALIRNATEYEHFCERPARVFHDEQGRQVIGYYGAIAEWFDVDLVRTLAQDHPEALVLLVGRDTVDAAGRLADLQNVRLVGEVPYADLPYWLHGFDVALLPFQVIPLTLATNPVKVYEYLSAGKPVVSVDLPEMAQFEGLVDLASNATDFSAAVKRVLQRDDDRAAITARQGFAAKQTWAHRAADLDAALGAIAEPKVSVVVLAYNNLEYTQACLHSLELYSDYPNLEVIVVDNASTDGTQAYLQEWVARGPDRKFIANKANLGFSAGNNVGLAAAQGEYLVLLNNDTYVTPGWVRTMIAHLQRNPDVGLVGPVTNNIGNEARIEIHYSNMEEMIDTAQRFTLRHAGQSIPLATAAFFCVMLTRRAYEDVGPMDEAFGVGFFEDDDYCRRLEQKGYRVLCAEDVFVHHHLSASFNRLKAEAKQKLFEENKAVYERKWGAWVPHTYRERPPL